MTQERSPSAFIDIKPQYEPKITWPPILFTTLSMVAFVLTLLVSWWALNFKVWNYVVMHQFSRLHHFPYPYNEKNTKKIQSIIEEYRKKNKTVRDNYNKEKLKIKILNFFLNNSSEILVHLKNSGSFKKSLKTGWTQSKRLEEERDESRKVIERMKRNLAETIDRFCRLNNFANPKIWCTKMMW